MTDRKEDQMALLPLEAGTGVEPAWMELQSTV